MGAVRTVSAYVIGVVAIACAIASWNWQFFYSMGGQKYADSLVIALSILATGGGLVSFFISGKGFGIVRLVGVFAVLVSAPIWLFIVYLLLNPGLYVSH